MIEPRHQDTTVPPRITGPAHVFAAAGYSWGGLKKLWGETAFRHELAAFLACMALLECVGASAAQLFILVGLFLLLVAVEALNTAIECLTDHVSPEWSVAARNAKDLGSLAVMCVLGMVGLYVIVVVGCI
ncbi:diacylglycerol kinase [Pseudorhodobacter aquimaris]|uniref:diacylglycerol kinase n=1 Tax=Pseudorhodobacter aquimaris TaxID=687412 RepID=UPI00067C2AE6|nr:diacylglycerol kinase [Pseudorhodobacter aquimaris]